MILSPGYGIVIMSKFREILDPLVASIRKYAVSDNCKKVLIFDGSDQRVLGFETMVGEEPFSWGVNATRGMSALLGLDVFLLNDDVLLLESDTFERISSIAYENPSAGIVTPMIKGWCVPPRARWHERDQWPAGETEYYLHDDEYISFPFTFLKRAMIRVIGDFDPRYLEYGWSDREYCFRAKKYGWKSMITKQVAIQHGDGSTAGHEGQGKSWCVTFVKDGYFKRNPSSPFRAS